MSRRSDAPPITVAEVIERLSAYPADAECVDSWDGTPLRFAEEDDGRITFFGHVNVEYGEGPDPFGVVKS